MRLNSGVELFFFFQAEDGIRDTSVTGSSDVCSSDLNYLNHAITSALVSMRSPDLSDAELTQLGMMIRAVTDIERIGDHAENITEYAQMAIDENVVFSDDANGEMTKYNNSAAKYNTYYQAYQNAYNRAHMPKGEAAYFRL